MKKPYVVAIAGGTCSGKSTLTDLIFQKLQGEYKVLALNMDNYFKKDPPPTIAPISRIVYVEHNHPDALELDVLMADFRKALTQNWDLILIEGLFALYLDEIREAADLKIFVDLASDARLVRRITKHMGWGQTLDQVTNRYLDTVWFRHNELIEPTRWHADMVINGTLDNHRGADIALTYILAHIA